MIDDTARPPPPPPPGAREGTNERKAAEKAAKELIRRITKKPMVVRMTRKELAQAPEAPF